MDPRSSSAMKCACVLNPLIELLRGNFADDPETPTCPGSQAQRHRTEES